MNFKGIAIQAQLGQPFGAIQQLAVFLSGGGGEPAATAAHHFMNNQHARVGVIFGNHVPKVTCALLRRCPGAQRLLDRKDVVINGFGQTDHGEAVVVVGQKRGKIGGCGIGVVAADSMKYIDAIFNQLIGRYFLRVLTFLHQAAFNAVFNVGQFNAAVADQRTAETVQQSGFFTDSRGDGIKIAQQQTFIAATIADDFNGRIDFSITLDQAADS